MKFSNKVIVKKGLTVSLFTREWIEIDLMQLRVKQYNVSLFTREWIEIKTHNGQERQERVSLFTREWIEIDALHVLDVILMRLPLYEGVD